MERPLRIVLVALLVVALPAAAAGLPSAAVSVSGSAPGVDDRRAAGSGVADSADVADPTVARSDGETTADAGRSATGRAGDHDAAVGASDRTVAGDGVPTRLQLTGEATSSYATPAADVSATLSTGDGELDAGYGMYVYEYQLRETDNETRREQLVAAALAYAERRLETLREREIAAVRSYQNGSSSTRDLVRTLVRIDAEATTVRRALQDIKRYTDGVGTAREITAVQQGLRSVEGPVRGRLARGLQGESMDIVVHVAATLNGLVLETIDDGSYVRTAVRFDNREPGGGPGNISLVESIMTEIYPTTFPNRTSTRLDATDDSELFFVSFPNRQGTIGVYLDTGTGKIYREQQTLSLDQIATTRIAAETDNDVRVRVNRTSKGNPILINVTDTATGDPVDAVIRIDGQRVGRTGDDGILWAVGPRGEYTVTALTFRETVNVTVPAVG